ncbi:MAG: type I 3-dehydroquinate dehydratase [Bacteroidales bacterium]|nr:type I 3-dehydroquinate dehydratase [Bacteroidales bacterium]MDD4671198.1 type I 3-dehydroquinate dehydratase [Bacteroidales bacterium]
MAETRSGDAIEIRLDKCDYTREQIKELFSCRHESLLIATYRSNLPSQHKKAVEVLSSAILAGANFIDLDIDFPKEYKDWVIRLALNKGCRLIISYHGNVTESIDKLRKIADTALQQGADYIKIVPTAHSQEDVDTILSLYNYYDPSKLIAFSMGEKWKDSRKKSFALGAPLLYAATRRGAETAFGQPKYFELIPEKEILLKGTITDIPSSKSAAQRFIVLAALAQGKTTLYKLSHCEDIDAALKVAVQLGADVVVEDDKVTIDGHQNILEYGLHIEEDVLYVGESGLLARLCIAIAGMSRLPIIVVGSGTLLERVILHNISSLKKIGMEIVTVGKYLPVSISGPLKGGKIEVSGKHGSQLISGLLIALSQCHRDSILKVKGVTSAPYLDLTTEIASYFGLSGYYYPEEPDDDTRTYYISGNQVIRPVIGTQVEKDWSAAAFFIVAGAIMGDITIEGMDFFSTQGDAMIFDIMEESNVDIVRNETTGTINVRKSVIYPFYYDITNFPDLFAPLFLLALRAEGESCIKGIGRLKNKESNRAKTFLEEFRTLGAHAFIEGDEMFIYGRHNNILGGGWCSSHGDHRLAMALMIARLFSSGKIYIDDLNCINKSFPDFDKILQSVKKRKI